MLSIPIRSHGALLVLGAPVFALATVASWLNALDLVYKLVISASVFFIGLMMWLGQHKATRVTRLNLRNNSCAILVDDKAWLAVSLTVHYCDELLLVLKLHGLDAATPQYGHVFWLWLYPGVISSVEQRALRSFLASEFDSHRPN